MSFADYLPSQPLPFIPRALAAALGLVLSQASLSAMIQPESFTKVFGFPQKTPINPFVYAFAARELCLGLSLSLLAALGQWKSVGLVGTVSIIAGISDGVVETTRGKGLQKGFMTHFLPTIVAAPVVLYLLAFE